MQKEGESSIEDLQFYIKKLADTESTLKRIRRLPHLYRKEDYQGVLTGFSAAINFVDQLVVATPSKSMKGKTNEKYIREMLVKKFQNIKKRYSQYSAADLSKMKFAEPTIHNKPTETMKEYTKSPEVTFVELENAEQLYEESKEKAQSEHEHIAKAVTEVKQLTDQLANKIESQDHGLKQISENVSETRGNTAHGNKDVAEAASGKGSYVGWRVKWAGLLGVIGAGVGTIFAPIIGTGIGAGIGAGVGVKIGGDIAKKVEKCGNEDIKEETKKKEDE